MIFNFIKILYSSNTSIWEIRSVYVNEYVYDWACVRAYACLHVCLFFI